MKIYTGWLRTGFLGRLNSHYLYGSSYGVQSKSSLTSLIEEDSTIRSIKSAIFHRRISKETFWLIINQKLAFQTIVKVAASHAFKQCRSK